MPDPLETLTDEDIVTALWASDDPEEIAALRLEAAQRGLHSGVQNMDPREKARRKTEGPVT